VNHVDQLGVSACSGDPGPENQLPGGEWAAVLKVAGSKLFLKSPRLKSLLLFVAERSLTGHRDQLTEFEIGRRLFQRGSEYVPTDDSIVRSSIRQLRLKLKEYYETEGHADGWTVEIPKGSYVAVVQPRESPVPTQVDDVVSPRTLPSNRRILLLAGALAASLIANALLLLRPIASVKTTPESMVNTLVMKSPNRTQLIVDDFAYVLMSNLAQREFSLDEYTARAYVPRENVPSHDPALLKLWDLLGTRYIISLGAMGTVDRVLRAVPDTSKIVVRHARNMAGRDFNDGNIILFGSKTNNPWSNLFEERLNFRMVRGKVPSFINVQAKPGELERYSNPQDASINSGQGYARVALLPNMSGNGYVLLLTGLNMVTAEAAAEFVTNPKYLGEALKLFNARNAGDLPSFELLLRTSSFDTTPKDMSILAWRRIQ
jgi:hypothetical protein